MKNFYLYVEKILNDLNKILQNDNNFGIENFENSYKNIKLEINKTKDFFSFEYFRIEFNLDNASWLCLLISIFNEVNNSKINPIEMTTKIYFNNKIKFYDKIQSLKSISYSFFLNINDEIDKYILNFLMTNGEYSNFPGEFKIYFPSDTKTKIERENEAKSIADICKLSMSNIYFLLKSDKGEGKKT